MNHTPTSQPKRNKSDLPVGLTIFFIITRALTLTLFITARMGQLPFGTTRGQPPAGQLTITAKQLKFTQLQLQVTAGETVQLHSNSRLFSSASFSI